MNQRLGGTLWRLAIFVTVCALGFFALLAIFAQLRFGDETIYEAEFSDVGGLEDRQLRPHRRRRGRQGQDDHDATRHHCRR